MRRDESKDLEEILWPRGKEIPDQVVLPRKSMAEGNPQNPFREADGVLTYSGQLSNKAKENLRREFAARNLQGTDK